MSAKPFVLPILREEAARNGYTVEELIARDNHAHVTAVRQYAMWRAKKETGRPLVEIARFFLRDHTTVLYACRKLEAIPSELRGVFPPRLLRRRQRDPSYGLKFEGKPCPHGHVLRYWSTGQCVECRLTRDRHYDRKKTQFYAEAAE